MSGIFLDRLNLCVTVLPNTPYKLLAEYLDLCGYCLPFKIECNNGEGVELKNIFCQKGIEYWSLFGMNIFSSLKCVRVDEDGVQILYGKKVIKSTSGYKVAPMILCSQKHIDKISDITFRVVNVNMAKAEYFKSYCVNLSDLEKKLIDLI